MKRQLVEQNLPQDSGIPDAKRARSVTVNLCESPLRWLHARHKICDRQFAAGELLRRDYEYAGLPQRTTMSWDGLPPERLRGRLNSTDGVAIGRLDAKARFLAAIERAGRGLGDILWRTVCAGERIPAVERDFGWPSHSGHLILRLALDQVADYYRVP